MMLIDNFFERQICQRSFSRPPYPPKNLCMSLNIEIFRSEDIPNQFYISMLDSDPYMKKEIA